MGHILLTAAVIGNVLTAPMFCEGIRTAEQYNGMTYKNYLADYALNTMSADGIQNEAEMSAVGQGQTKSAAYQIGLMMRAQAKASMAGVHSTFVKRGQRSLCGKESSNW